jgi:diacylglycerol kinase (ATP)
VDPLLVITNTDAGTADTERLDAALAVLRAGASVEVASTSNPGELDGVLHRAASRRIVVAGGDGSLHAVVRALHRRRELEGKVLGLLPLGTGNDFARGVGIPLDTEEAARLVLAGHVRPVDLIVDEVGEVVVNSVHAGAGAEASRHGARWKSTLGSIGLGSTGLGSTGLGSIGVGKLNLGRLGYPIGAAITAIRPPTLRLRVKVDGTVVNDLDQPVLMVALGNGSSVGGGTELNPDADPENGLIDVVITRPLAPHARIGYAVGLLRGSHHERPDVLHVAGETVSVSGEEFWCSADGEIYGPERQRTWHLERAAYSLVLP